MIGEEGAEALSRDKFFFEGGRGGEEWEFWEGWEGWERRE